MSDLLSQGSEFSRLVRFAHSHQLPFDSDLQAQGANGVVVWTIERIKRRGGCFGGSIAPHEGIIEQDQDFWYLIMPGNSDGTKQIINGIIPSLSNRHYDMIFSYLAIQLSQ
jgi:hypothetical protein